MATQELTFTWASTGAASISGTVSVTSDGTVTAEDVALTSLQSAKQVNVAFLHADLKLLYMICSRNCTVETNGTGGGADDTISLTAGVPYVWYAASGVANPFSADVENIRLTNGYAGTAVFNLRGLYDATP